MKLLKRIKEFLILWGSILLLVVLLLSLAALAAVCWVVLPVFTLGIMIITFAVNVLVRMKRCISTFWKSIQSLWRMSTSIPNRKR